jgi:outer membrane lipoprotein-sorting protein
MSDHNRFNPDDLLETSLAALRSETIPPGPSARTVADTLSALRRAEARPKLWQRVIHMTLTQKIAAAVALTLGGLTLYFLLSLFGGFASVSYAQVADQIRAVRSMTCTVTIQGTDPNKPAVSMRMMFMDPDKTRMQMPGTRMVVITDAAAHRVLMLNDSDKTATTTDFSTTNTPATRPTDQKLDLIEQFKNLANGESAPAPDRQIGQVRAKGFHILQRGYDAIVYADPKSGVPIEIDFEHLPGADHVSMSDFQFDANLDPALFSVTPPDGYKVVNQKMTVNFDLAENVAPLLKAYAAHKDGQFPPQLTDWAELIKTLHPDPKLDPDAQKIFSDMGTLTALLPQYHRGTQWDYLPTGVKLGDADKIVFWYQPKGSTTYKAVYGDLRIAEVTADQLPPRQSEPATTSPTAATVESGPQAWEISALHLHIIGIALIQYVKEHAAYPDTLSDLKSDDITADTLTCPADGKPYFYRKPATAHVPPHTVVAFEVAPSRKDPAMVNILCADGDVEGFREVDANAIIAKGER